MTHSPFSPEACQTRIRDNWCLSATLIIFAVMAVSLAFPIFKYHYFLDDQGGWFFNAKVWLNLGIPPYTGILVENKPPGIFLVFALANLLPGDNHLLPRLLAWILLLGGGVAIWQLARKHIGQTAALWAPAAYCALLLWQPTEPEGIDYTESFMLAFSALAFLAYSARRRRGALFSGLLMGCAILFKQTAVCSLGALALWPFFRHKSDWKTALREIALMLSGAVAVNAAIVLFFMTKGSTVAGYMDWVWLFAKAYWNHVVSDRSGQFLNAWRVWWVFIPITTVFLLSLAAPRRKEDDGFLFVVSAWLMADFFAVSVSGSFFLHQFKQIIPSLALVCGAVAQLFAFVWRDSRVWRGVLAWGAVLFCLTATHTGVQNLPEKPELAQDYAAGVTARDLTKETELVYVDTDKCGAAQAYSHRHSPLGFFRIYSPPIPELFLALERKPPALVLINKKSPQAYTLQYITHGWEFLLSVGDYDFYTKDKPKMLARLRTAS